jgi:small subunit ribosomal protein S17
MAEATEQSGIKIRGSRVGVVYSAKGDKTARVELENIVKHARYGKYLRRRTKLAVHDEQNTAQVGDMVEILPCRRMSKTKSWRLVRVVRPATARD